MAKIINAKANDDGKVIVEIFKEKYDVTKKLKDGKAHLSLYGVDYEIHALPGKEAKKIAVKKSKDNGAEVNVGFIETPQES